jgi:hypothetical protein
MARHSWLVSASARKRDSVKTAVERLAELDFTPDYVTTQREALVLSRALAPELFDLFAANLEHRLGDPEFIELTKCGWEARSWHPDDPRIEELASAVATNLLADRALLTIQTAQWHRADAVSRYGVVNHHRENEAPSIARLNRLVEGQLRAAGIEVPRQ